MGHVLHISGRTLTLATIRQLNREPNIVLTPHMYFLWNQRS